ETFGRAGIQHRAALLASANLVHAANQRVASMSTTEEKGVESNTTFTVSSWAHCCKQAADFLFHLFGTVHCVCNFLSQQLGAAVSHAFHRHLQGGFSRLQTCRQCSV